MTPLIDVSGLTIRSACQPPTQPLMQPLELTLHAGRPLTILGETGSGKSLLAQAIMGLLPAGLHSDGDVYIQGQRLNTSERQALWGTQLTMLPQEPARSLDPTMVSQQQVSEVHQLVLQHTPEQSQQHSAESLQSLGLADDGNKIPSQLSGGMAQRLAFAAATAAGAQIVLADEPTKGLDASRRNDICRLLRQHIEQSPERRGLLTITHDVEVARQLGGDIIVMRKGDILERGSAEQVLNNPASDYARQLIAAAPSNWPHGLFEQPEPASSKLLLEARGLGKQRGGRQLFESLNLQLAEGEILGLCGDSGSGKSTLGNVLLGLLSADAGDIHWHTRVTRWQKLKLYQEPPAAFADGVALGQLIDDVIQLHGLGRQQVAPLLEALSLDASLLERPSNEVSGGELQRIALLRALLMRPKLLIADEPTSRLDPVTARDVTVLMTRALRTARCSAVFISHDLDQLRHSCDRVLQLSEGQLQPIG